MDRYNDSYLVAQEKQARYQAQAAQDRLAQEAENNYSQNDHKGLKQQVGEQLIQLGYKLTGTERA